MRNRIVYLFALALIFLVVAPVMAAAGLSVEVNGSTFAAGEQVLITGLLEIDNPAGEQFGLTVVGPGGEQVFNDQAACAGDGSFSVGFQLAESAENGTYTVYAAAAGYNARADFAVAGSSAPRVTIETAKGYYQRGQVVLIQGEFAAANPPDEIGLAVTGPGSSEVEFIDQVEVSDGEFQAVFSLSGSVKEGSYTISVAGGSIRGTGMFVVDNTDPTISAKQPAGDITEKRPLISAEVSDTSSGISSISIELKLDGSLRNHSFDGGQVSYQPATNLSVGSHTVALLVKDRAGNESSAAWSFTIKETSSPGGGGDTGGGSPGGGTGGDPNQQQALSEENQNTIRIQVQGQRTNGTTAYMVDEGAFVDVPQGNTVIVDATGADYDTEVEITVAANGIANLLANTGANERPLNVETPHGTISPSAELLELLAASGENLVIETRRAPQPENSDEGDFLGDSIEIDTNIDGEADVTLPLTGVELSRTNLERLGAWVVHSNGTRTFYPAVVNRDAGGNPVSLTITIPQFSVFTVMEYKKTFIDILNHWAKGDIELMAYKQIAKGISTDSFAPENVITRAEFATLLVRALGIKPVAGSTQFKDVAAGAWYAPTVKAALEATLVQGTGAESFSPDSNITREQMAVMIVRAYKHAAGRDLPAGETVFSDAGEISSWAKAAVDSAAAEGIIQGMTASTFEPRANATRAQAIVMLKRLLASLGEI